ncbi:MAG: serine/threonine-protein phosphatase, partial [Actinomycetota bacterium]|nr:serine/threonine-protein phosphatase [Actinomycetota bacterium]
RFEGERFCTILFAVLSPGPTPTVTLAGGGHPSPLVRKADGRVEEVWVGGSVLGVFEDADIGSQRVTLEPGDMLVLYTDGAIEARRDGVMFGTEGVAATIASAPPAATPVAHAIEQAVLAHTGGTVSDDLAALVVHAVG